VSSYGKKIKNEIDVAEQFLKVGTLMIDEVINNFSQDKVVQELSLYNYEVRLANYYMREDYFFLDRQLVNIWQVYMNRRKYVLNKVYYDDIMYVMLPFCDFKDLIILMMVSRGAYSEGYSYIKKKKNCSMYPIIFCSLLSNIEKKLQKVSDNIIYAEDNDDMLSQERRRMVTPLMINRDFYNYVVDEEPFVESDSGSPYCILHKEWQCGDCATATVAGETKDRDCSDELETLVGIDANNGAVAIVLCNILQRKSKQWLEDNFFLEGGYPLGLLVYGVLGLESDLLLESERRVLQQYIGYPYYFYKVFKHVCMQAQSIPPLLDLLCTFDTPYRDIRRERKGFYVNVRKLRDKKSVYYENFKQLEMELKHRRPNMKCHQFGDVTILRGQPRNDYFLRGQAHDL